MRRVRLLCVGDGVECDELVASCRERDVAVSVTVTPGVDAATAHVAEAPVDCVVVDDPATVAPFVSFVRSAGRHVPIVHWAGGAGESNRPPDDLADATVRGPAAEVVAAVERLLDRPTSEPGAEDGRSDEGVERGGPTVATTTGTMHVDGEGVVTWANAVVADALGARLDELVGRRLDDAAADHAAVLVDAIDVATETGTPRTLRCEREGSRLHATVVPLPDGDVQVVGRRVGDLRRTTITADEPAFVETVLNSLADVFFVLDLNLQFVHWNDRLNAVTGYDDAEIRSMSPLEFFHDDGIEAATAAISEILDTGYASRELELVTRYGDRIPYEFTGSLVYDENGDPEYFCGVARDITERKEAEQALRESEQQFNSIVEGVTDYAIFRLDTDGIIESWNSGAEAIKGYTEEEIVGTDYSVFYTEEAVEAGRPETNLEVAARTGRVEDEGWRVRSDGSRFWAHVVMTALYDESGDLDGFVKVTRDMTERRAYEQQLRQEKELTERILETSPVGIAVIEEDGTVTPANSRGQALLGTDDREDGSVTAGEFSIYDTDGEPIPRTDWPVADVFDTGDPVQDWLCQIDHPDGGRRWISVSAAPVLGDDGAVEQVVSAVEDVTELKTRQEELVEERNQTQELLRTAPVAISVRDVEGNTVLANERAQAALGLAESDIIEGNGDPERWTIRDADGDAIDPERDLYRLVVESGEPLFDLEISIERPDGERIWFSINVAPIEGPEGEVTRVITAGEDITGLKERERELERQRAELDSVVEELRRSNAELEQFAYVASHDLKEPLRMVSSYLQLVERRYADELDDDGQEFIDFAVDGAERMREMIDALLTYSRLGRRGESFEPVDCNEVLEAVLANLEVAIEEVGAEVDAADLPTLVGDQAQLRQLFQNLVGNAIAYAGDADPRVAISVEKRADEWCFEVADNGVGIPPDRTERIFDLFVSDGERGGTGIGLAICQKIVNRHGGRIWVESAPGEGSSFYFVLPDWRERDAPLPTAQRA